MGITEKIKEDLKNKIQRNLDKTYITRVLNILGTRPVLSTYGSTFSSESDKILNIASIKSLKKAYSGKYPVAYGSLFLPYEMFYALEIVPFLPEVMAGFTAGLGIADKTLKEASSRWYTPDLCTFHRSASGAVEMDIFPKPDFLICANLACDAAQKTFYIDAIKYGVEKNYFLIDVPYYNDESSLKYLESQIKDLCNNISALLGKKFDIQKLKEAILLSNQFRHWAIKVNDLRKELQEYPKNFNGLNFILPFHGLAGTEDAVGVYKSMYEEFKILLDKQNNLKEFKTLKNKKRVLWLHLKPYYKNKIFTMLEENDYILAFEEINNVYWPELDPQKPFESLALKMLSHPLNGSIENRVSAIIRMAQDYKIDCAILFSHWGCRHSNGGARVIKDSLKKHGIPLLVLDGDCLNRANSSEGQMMTRLQGFMEIVDSTGK
ncbi:MAG: 2-hydroxyacyl-CoA dehydratase [Actinobacteria bacterium]|nr:2-hydroxyacyl-CoA dehydratase [Actinomycetota bacterium]